MTNVIYPPTLMADFYKVSHRAMYPEGCEYVYSTWIPRESRIDGVDEVVAFGFQAFIKEFLIDSFDDNFFCRPRTEIVDEYKRFIKNTLGDPNPETDHIEALWNLGYLPLKISAVPEGTVVPIRVPMLTIENTKPEFFWLTNFIETIFSCEIWQASTSATIAREYRKLLDSWAEKTGDTEAVDFQGHDFSMRGMTSISSAAKSGAGHLLSFSGTDTIPAINFLEAYYNANIETELVGTSIPATEHSVMCAYGQDEETSFRRIIKDIHPEGLVSIVSDTWDLWNVLTVTLPKLKNEILNRDGRLVIRPDSGDPVDIICGTDPFRSDVAPSEPSAKGVIELLWDTFGGTINEKGYKVLDPHVGAIYGDSITLSRANEICSRLAKKGFASTNIVFGIGSYTYQHVTRDTFGFALKSTWVQINGVEQNIFKDPITDSGMKKSLTGRVVVLRDNNEKLYVVDGLKKDEQMSEINNRLVPIFLNGEIAEDSLANIRYRLNS